MNEGEYQKQREELQFDIQIYDGLIFGLICVKIALTVLLLLAVAGGLSWYLGLTLYISLAAILIVLIRRNLKAIESKKRDLYDLIEPFG